MAREHKGHTSVPPKKKVIIRLHNGEEAIDRYLYKEGNMICFERLGKIHQRFVKTLLIYKEQNRK